MGCIPAKAFLRSSRLCRECREAAAFGVQVDAFRFDLPTVVERKNGIVAALVKGIGDSLQGAHVDVFEGHARLTARDRVQVGDQALQAANILIATGARPAVPTVPGFGSPRVIDSDSAFDLTDVPGRVAIIGAGYIGLEFATFFSDIGADVTVFEMLPQVAGGCDRDVADRLQQCLRRSGVTFHLSCQVLGVDDGTVHFADGSGPDQAYPGGPDPQRDRAGARRCRSRARGRRRRLLRRGHTRSPTRARPTCQGSGPAATSPGSTCWRMSPPARGLSP